jgi:hypothetical protein
MRGVDHCECMIFAELPAVRRACARRGSQSGMDAGTGLWRVMLMCELQQWQTG